MAHSSVAFCLVLVAVEELTVILEPLALASRKLVLLAVNDNADNSGSGGSHWSLLCYHREQNAFFHFDSMRQLNARYAKQLQEKLCRLINCKYAEQLQEKLCTFRLINCELRVRLWVIVRNGIRTCRWLFCLVFGFFSNSAFCSE